MTGELPRTGRSAVGTSWQPTSERTSQAYNCQKQAPAAFNIMLPATLLQNPDRAKGRVPPAAGPRAEFRRLQGQGPIEQGQGPSSTICRANIRFPGSQQRFSQLPGGLCPTSGGPLCNFRGAFVQPIDFEGINFPSSKINYLAAKQPFSST